MRTSLLIAALLFVPSFAKAEIIVGNSIEWLVADSDRVIMGKIVKVEAAGQHQAVTVDVSKTLRGKHEDKVILLVMNNGGQAAQGWHKAAVPMLFCLQDTKDGWMLRRADGNHAAVFLGKAEPHATIEVFTRDFKHLTEPEAIVKYMEAYAKSIPADWKKKHTVIHVPHRSPVYTKLWAGSSVLLTVPVDPQMEQQARAWCKSKNTEERAQGAYLLRLYKNDENIKILRGLLNDPGEYRVTSSQVVGDKTIRREVRAFPVRRNAYDALRELGVEVEPPIVELPIGDDEAK